MAGKTYWVGDDKDNKSVCIKRKIYAKGDEIPADGVDQEQLDKWKKKGLIAVGEKSAPVVIIDTQAVTNLKTEIASLKRDVERIPGLEREVTDLERAAEKAKGGSKAKAVKDLKAEVVDKDNRIKVLEAEKAHADEAWAIKIKDLETDIQEKAALIEKLNGDKSGDGPDKDDSAGPGGA